MVGEQRIIFSKISNINIHSVKDMTPEKAKTWVNNSNDVSKRKPKQKIANKQKIIQKRKMRNTSIDRIIISRRHKPQDVIFLSYL